MLLKVNIKTLEINQEFPYYKENKLNKFRLNNSYFNREDTIPVIIKAECNELLTLANITLSLTLHNSLNTIELITYTDDWNVILSGDKEFESTLLIDPTDIFTSYENSNISVGDNVIKVPYKIIINTGTDSFSNSTLRTTITSGKFYLV